MKITKAVLIKILIIEGFIGACALIFILVSIWYRPLGPSLGLTTSQPQAIANLPQGLAESPAGLEATPTATAISESRTISEPTATPASVLSQIASMFKPPAAAAKTLCNGPVQMTILLIGSDSREEGYLYGLADSLRLVRVDYATPSIQTLDIPRDLWVEIPGISDHYGITHAKLNQAFFFGSTGMGYYDGAGEGPGLTARTLKENFGVTVDHYLAVDMKTFVRIIDSIDGIDIYNDSVIDLNQNHDGENPAYVLEPGNHHLDGSMALRLAMNRYPTIFQRAINQDIVLHAVERKLLTPAMFTRLPNIIAAFTKSVQTDLSPSDINKLVCLSQAVPKEDIRTLSFPEDLFTGSHIYDPYRKVNTYVMQADFSQLSTYFSDFLKGSWLEK